MIDLDTTHPFGSTGLVPLLSSFSPGFMPIGERT